MSGQPARPLPVVVLELITKWDGWVKRRVDSFSFAGDDERVLSRRQSMDFVMPEELRTAASDYGFPGTPVPVTIVDKWRIPEFSFRDESGRAIPLLARSESTPVMHGALEALALEALRPNGGDALPPVISQLLADIVDGERSEAIGLCASFREETERRLLAARKQSIMTADDHQAVSDARRLAGDPGFMGLAFELARGFVLFASYPRAVHGRHILKFSYNSYVVDTETETDPQRIRVRHLMRRIRDGSWDFTESRVWAEKDDEDTGRIVLSALADLPIDGPGERGPGTACVLATISEKGERRWRMRRNRRTVRLRPNSAVAIENVPAGDYVVSYHGCSGFLIVGSADRSADLSGPVVSASGSLDDEVTVRARATVRSRVHARRTRISAPVVLAPLRIAVRARRHLRFSRGLALHSKPLAIRVRVGDGGRYHCEFEAPAGMHVTRAKLVSDVPVVGRPRGRELDLVLSSTQRAHLYARDSPGRPAAAYVYVNLRPRVETAPRPGYWAAVVAAAVVVFTAIAWDSKKEFGEHGLGDPSAMLVLLLGAPAALTAYFGQPSASRVTDSMLYGLRRAALLPAVLPLVMGAVVLVGAYREWATFAQWAVVAASGLTIAVLGGGALCALHPREQRRSDYDQGEDFERRYSLSADRDDRQAAAGDGGSVTHPNQDADAVRDGIMMSATGFKPETRRLLLGQKRLLRRKRRHEVPPALYFDSAETPPTFPYVFVPAEAADA